MDNVIKPVKYRWENKLSLENRRLLVLWYQEGYAIHKIAKTLNLKSPTIQYHLKAAGVYVPHKLPTKWNQTINVTRTIISPNRALSCAITIETIGPYRFGHLNEIEARQIEMEQKFPKSYKQYLDRAKKRDPVYKYYGLQSPRNTPIQ